MHRLPFLTLTAYITTLPAFGLAVGSSIGGKTLVWPDVFFAALVVSFVVAGSGQRLPFRLELGLLAGGCLLTLAALAVTAGTRASFLELGRTAYSMIVLLVLAHIRLTQQQRALVVRAWVFTVVAVALAAALGWLAVVVVGMPSGVLGGARSPSLGAGIIRASAFMHPNALSLYFALGIAAVVCAVATRAVRCRWGPRILLFIVMVAVLTFSRGLAGLLVTVTVLAGMADAPPWLRRWRSALALGALGLVVLVVIDVFWPILSPPVWRPDLPFGVGLDTRRDAYWLWHTAATRMFVTHPVAGVGLGGFGAHFCDFTSAAERGSVWPPRPCGPDWDPHSSWFAHAAEGGLAGLAAWSVLLCGILMMLRRSAPQDSISLPSVTAAALIGLFVSGLHVDFTHLKFVWAFLGLALGAAVAHDGEPGVLRNPTQ